jgi:CelD/BcsL family acetyltransferase involved in cellulose biosynthesis
MNFICINSINNELECSWKDIERNNNLITPFQQLNWIKNYISFNNDLNRKKVKLYFIIFKKEEKTIAIFPLCIHNNFVKSLEYIGAPFNDINVPILSNKYNFEPNEIKLIKSQIKNFFKKKVDCINFQNQPTLLINNQINFFSFNNILNVKPNYKININNNYLNNIKKTKYWKDLIRRKNKYIIPNFITYRSLVSKSEKEEAFNFYFKFKYNQLERTNRKNYLRSELNKKFLRNFFLENEIFALLSKDNKIIACVCCLLNNKILYYLFPTYNNLFNSFALGQQLINYILFDKSRNYEALDFTGGDEKYKKFWSNDINSLTNSFIANNFKGYVFKKMLKIINIIKNKNFLYLNILKILRYKSNNAKTAE